MRNLKVAVVTDWSNVISDIASPADEAVLRDAIDEFNFAATSYREARSPSCFLSADGVLVARIAGLHLGQICPRLVSLGHLAAPQLATWCAATWRASGQGSPARMSDDRATLVGFRRPVLPPSWLPTDRTTIYTPRGFSRSLSHKSR